MSVPKKKDLLKTTSKKTVIVTKSKVPAKSSPFAKKIDEVNALLAKTKLVKP